ncbi:ABC transporter substrate-binding protein [Streptomyces sp. R39]|uniref:ABC transporter substrate-binding protein n=1 Tax=Streptomyces sp. R39 TaxID=3238631 RepID=A0AB39R2S9_9ACTN
MASGTNRSRAAAPASGNTVTDPLAPGAGRRGVLGLLGLGAAAVPLGALLTACSSATPADGNSKAAGSAPVDAGGDIEQLTIALPGSLSTLDVSHEAGILNYIAVLLAQESLLSVSPDGALGAGLATSWTHPDPLTYVYELRQNVTFWDGTPLTAADVVDSVEYHLDPANASQLAYAYSTVKSVRATGPHQVTIRLKNPYAMFQWTPTPSTLLIGSKAYAARHKGKLGTASALLMGTGPFRVTSFAPDDHVEFERNEKWWGGHVRVKKLRLTFVADDNTRLLAMRSGELDGAVNLPADRASQWERIKDTEVHYASDHSVVALAFNTSKAPWNDPKVRQAVAHATDRQGYVRSILRGKGEVASALVTRGQWTGLLTDAEVRQAYTAVPQYEYDIDRARTLLASSTAKDGFTEELHYPASGSQLGRAALALKEALVPLGITLNVKEVPLEKWISELSEPDRGLHFLWYYPTTGDPAELVEPYLDSAAIGSTNIAHYRNQAVHKDITEERASVSPAARGKDLADALQRAGADLPYHSLWWGQSATALSSKVGVKDFGTFFFIGPWATRLYPAGS